MLLIKKIENDAIELNKFRQLGAWILNTVAKDTISPRKIFEIPLIDSDAEYIERITTEKQALSVLKELRGF